MKRKSKKIQRLVRLRSFTEQKASLEFARTQCLHQEAEKNLQDKKNSLQAVSDWKCNLHQKAGLDIHMYQAALAIEQFAVDSEEQAQMQLDKVKVLAKEARKDMADKSLEVRVAEKRAHKYKLHESNEIEKKDYDQISDTLLSVKGYVR